MVGNIFAENGMCSNIEKYIEPDLGIKSQPLQQRSSYTFEKILKTTAELLEKVGFEAISTNVICKVAGITPPALYRYFPNKYAVLKELGSQLMTCQNDAYFASAIANPVAHILDDKAAQVVRLKTLQGAVNSVTRQFPGAVWVMRAMRAIPTLHKVRLDSHDFVTDQTYTELRDFFPNTGENDLRLAVRLTIEMMYTATEMVFDNPDLDEDRINTEVSEMVVRYFAKFS